MEQILYSKVIETRLLLDGYIKIHDEIFVIQKGFTGIANKLLESIDFKSLSTRLSDINSELISILNDLALLDENQLGKSEARLKNTLIQFIKDVIKTVGKLSFVSNKLSEKAEGKSYPLREYNYDIKEYQMLIDTYLAQGSKLNSCFR